MIEKAKILYIEDMKNCFDKTNETLGKSFKIDWKNNYFNALKAITENLRDYSAVILDINLDYDINKPNNEQTTEGLNLIGIIKREAERQEIDIPIICASSNGIIYREPSLEAGADIFIWKKELWERGDKLLEALVKKI